MHPADSEFTQKLAWSGPPNAPSEIFRSSSLRDGLALTWKGNSFDSMNCTSAAWSIGRSSGAKVMSMLPTLAQPLSAVVLSVSRDSAHRFTKPSCEAITLLKGLGIGGDAHLRTTVQHRDGVLVDSAELDPGADLVGLGSASSAAVAGNNPSQYLMAMRGVGAVAAGIILVVCGGSCAVPVTPPTAVVCAACIGAFAVVAGASITAAMGCFK